MTFYKVATHILYCYCMYVGRDVESKRVEFTSGDVREGATTAVPTESISLTSSLHKMVHTQYITHTE